MSDNTITLSTKQIIANAEQAALTAMKTVTPTPMVVTEHTNPLNDRSPIARAWQVDGGPCGFAWVHIYPARGPVVAELKRQGKGHKGYPRGFDVSMSGLTHTQSVEIKEAGARAYAKVLKAYGVECYADSRLD